MEKQFIQNSSNFNNEEIDLKIFLNLLLRNKFLISSITIISTLLTILLTLIAQPIYKGSFKIVVKNNAKPSTSPLFSSRLNMFLKKSDDIKTQEFILQSPSVLKPVYAFSKNYYERKDGSINDLTYEKWFQKTLEIKFTEGTSILNVTFKDSNKGHILDTLNLIKEKYQEYSKKDKKNQLTKAKEYFESQQIILNKKASKSMTALNEFSIKYGLGDVDGFVSLGKSNPSASQLFNSNFNQNNNINFRNNQETSGSGQRFANQFRLLENYEADYINYSSVLKPNSQYLKNLRIKIDNLRTSLKRPNEILLKHRELIQTANRYEFLSEDIERNLARTNLEIAKQQDAWDLISEPTISDSRVSPQRTKTTIFAFILSIVFASLLSLFKEKRSGYVYELNELKSLINCEFIDEMGLEYGDLNKELLIFTFKEKNINEQDQITFLNFSDTFDFNKFDLRKKNINCINLKISELMNLDNFKNVFFVISLGYLKRNEIIILNRFIKINQNKIKGWFEFK